MLNLRLPVLIVCFLALFWNSQAQTARIYDINSLKPIKGVLIIDQNSTTNVVSDANGKVDLSGFKTGDTLLFQHPSYNRQVIAKNEVTKALNTVYMIESAVDLGEFTVLANKRQQLETELPMTILPISKKEIQFDQPQTSADLLGQSGEVFIQKSQMGGGSPMIRGFSASRVLIVVDNIRMNNAIFRGGNLQNVISVDPNNVETAEVIFGPGSVIYGSDALGGVMNFHTIDPQYSFKKDSIAWMGDALLRYSSANNERTAHVLLGAGGEKWAAAGSVTMSFFDDMVTGSRPTKSDPEFGQRQWYQARVNGRDTVLPNPDVYQQRDTEYDQLNLMGKLKYQWSKNIDMELATHYSTTSNIPRYDRLIQERNGAPRSAEWYYGPQEWLLASLTTNFEIANDAWDRSRIVVGYQHFNESRNDRRFGDDRLRSRTELVDAFNLNLEFDKELKEGHDLYYGIEGVYNTVESNATRTNILSGASNPTSTRYPDGGSYWANAAAYLTYKWVINPKWTLNTGLRYTYITMQSKFEDTTFFNFPFDQIDLTAQALNGSFLGLTFKPNKKWRVKMNTSSGFRAPNIDDIAKVFDSEPGKVVMPNENLKPEFAYNADLGFVRKLADKGRIELTGFYTHLVNAMVRRKSSFNGQDSIVYDGELSEVQMITNTGSAHIYGATFAFKANLSRNTGVFQTFTWTGGEDLDLNVPLRHVAPGFGKTSLYFKEERFRGEFFMVYNTWRHWDELAPEEQGKPHLYSKDGSPAWVTLNVRTSLIFNRYLEFSAGIENILDQHYRPYSSGVSAAGRNFVVALRGRI